LPQLEHASALLSPISSPHSLQHSKDINVSPHKLSCYQPISDPLELIHPNSIVSAAKDSSAVSNLNLLSARTSFYPT
jgi:hypothetical protein